VISMKLSRDTVRRGGVTLVSIGLVAAGLGMVKLPQAGPRVTAMAGKSVQVGLTELSMGETANLARSELLLQDPTPLFLPTEYNSGRVETAMTTERSPGTSFVPIPAKLLFQDTNIQLALPEVVAIPPNALAVVTGTGAHVKLQELARQDEASAPLSVRAGQLQVLSMATGKTLWSQEIAAGAVKLGLESPWEFILAVNRAGLLSFPTVVKAGEGDLIDVVRIAEVLQEKHLGARLDPGIYRILLGP
jgi:hypothetical protein